LFEFVVRVDNS